MGVGSGCANLLPPTLMADPDAVPTLITFLGRDDPGFHPSRHSKSRRARTEDAGPAHKNH